MPGISTGLPLWEIEREKAFVSFSPCFDLTAPLSKVGRKGVHLAVKQCNLHLNVGTQEVNSILRCKF